MTKYFIQFSIKTYVATLHINIKAVSIHEIKFEKIFMSIIVNSRKKHQFITIYAILIIIDFELNHVCHDCHQFI